MDGGCDNGPVSREETERAEETQRGEAGMRSLLV
jgi:hypothetical protein